MVLRSLNTLILLVLCAFSAVSQTPVINFHRAYGGTEAEAVGDMMFNQDGNLVIIGTTNSNDYDLIDQPTNDQNFWFLELDADGNNISEPYTTFNQTPTNQLTEKILYSDGIWCRN